MLTLNSTTLQQVADKAAEDAAQHPRWLNAIGRALVELDTNPYLEWQDGHLLIASPSGVVYAANGICQCQAFINGQPCWHRAAARLVRLHDEALGRQQQAAPVDWPQDLATGQPMDWYAAKRAVETGAIKPLGERLAKARADMAELFA